MLTKLFPYFILILLSCTSPPQASSQQTEWNTKENQLNDFFQDYAKLRREEIKAIQNGTAIAKELNSPPEQVLIFGAVYIKANAESYLTFVSDTDQKSKIPGYLAIRKFSEPPQLSDLDTFTLEPDDIKDLQNCKPDECEVQLPAQTMEEFRKSVNWKSADTTAQVNTLAQQMALRALQSYIQGGNAALGTYRD